MSNFEERRLDREKRVENYIIAWKRGLEDQSIQSLSIEQLIMNLENYFSSQIRESTSLFHSSRVENNKFKSTFASICEKNFEAVCDKQYGSNVGYFVTAIITQKMPHSIEIILESFFPHYFTDRFTYVDGISLAQIEFFDMVFDDFISPCETEIYNICHHAIKESEATSLIDDAISNNDFSATFVYLINLGCENVISLLEKKVPEIIFEYFKSFYDRELLDEIRDNEQLKTDILDAFKLSATGIAESIYFEVDYPVSIALASAVMNMHSHYELQFAHTGVDCLITDFSSMDI